ncbi:SWIM zinc finger family protein [Halomicrococcus gelatinilyticus]|uniref:SWIM zinc finger family protein n=1 Tax=Halomicrococcus gelatinilyticus TaxID=1702103 RepID=UPI002E13ED93
MPKSLLDRLDPTNRILKRAQYEAFAFALLDGDVQVRNESHSDPDDHEYRVTIQDGVPVACECPADETYDGPCKHRVAVAIRPRILEVVATIQLVADGGRDVDDHTPSADPEPDSPENCDCDDLGEFPCWECVRTSRRDLPD